MNGNPDHPAEHTATDAFLVVKHDGRWDQVFRLARDGTTSIGRAKRNDVVIMDQGCRRLI